jgi:hypothetical protein
MPATVPVRLCVCLLTNGASPALHTVCVPCTLNPLAWWGMAGATHHTLLQSKAPRYPDAQARNGISAAGCCLIAKPSDVQLRARAALHYRYPLRPIPATKPSTLYHNPLPMHYCPYDHAETLFPYSPFMHAAISAQQWDSRSIAAAQTNTVPRNSPLVSICCHHSHIPLVRQTQTLLPTHPQPCRAATASNQLTVHVQCKHVGALNAASPVQAS